MIIIYLYIFGEINVIIITSFKKMLLLLVKKKILTYISICLFILTTSVMQ